MMPLPLLPGEVVRRSAASTSSTGPVWGGSVEGTAGVGLKRFGLAVGRAGLGGGARVC